MLKAEKLWDNLLLLHDIVYLINMVTTNIFWGAKVFQALIHNTTQYIIQIIQEKRKK